MTEQDPLPEGLPPEESPADKVQSGEPGGEELGARPIRVFDPGDYRRPQFPPDEQKDVPKSDDEHDRYRKAHEPMPGATATMIDTTLPPAPPGLRPEPIHAFVGPIHAPPKGSVFGRLLRTTDAKQIGLMYGTTAIVFFMIGGLMAMLMRAELARPGLRFLSPEQYSTGSARWACHAGTPTTCPATDLPH